MRLLFFAYHVLAGNRLRAASQKFTQTPVAATARILIAGDSVAFGVGAKPTESIAGYFGHDFPQAEIVNIAVSGVETPGLPAQLQSVAGQHFSLAVLIISGNDVVHFKNLQLSRKALNKSITVAKQLADHVVVMPEGNLGNAPIFPRLVSLAFTPRSRQVNQVFQAVAKERQVTFVNIFYERQADPWRHHYHRFYAVDYFHPSGVGYHDWYQAIRQAMDKTQVVI